MLKITIEDTETGRVIHREGKFVIMHTAEEHGAGMVTQGSGKFGPVDVIRCMMAHDYIREKIFADSPKLKWLYEGRDMFLRRDAVVDLTALERQAKGGDGEC